MVTRIVFAFTMVVSLALNAFSQVLFKYKLENDEIVFNVGNTRIPYKMGTKTAEYIMGYLANSNMFSYLEKKDVVYDSKTSTIVKFSNNNLAGAKNYGLGFLKAEDKTDVIILFDYETELARFKISPNDSAENVMKVDYALGQIIKGMNSFYVMGNGQMGQAFCIPVINIANGIPIEIEFGYGNGCL